MVHRDGKVQQVTEDHKDQTDQVEIQGHKETQDLQVHPVPKDHVVREDRMEAEDHQDSPDLLEAPELQGGEDLTAVSERRDRRVESELPAGQAPRDCEANVVLRALPALMCSVWLLHLGTVVLWKRNETLIRNWNT